MAASLRCRCGTARQYLFYVANHHSNVLERVQRKHFHSRYLSSCQAVSKGSLSHHKLSGHTLIKALGVRYASSDVISKPPLPEGYILDTPPVPTSEMVKDSFSLPDLTALGEPTLASQGFGINWSSAGLYERMLEFVHVGFDVPWFVSVALVSLGLRVLIIPVFIWQKKSLIKFSNISPEMNIRKKRYEEAKRRGNIYESEMYQMDLNTYMKENPFNKFGMILGPLCQAVIFVSLFTSLRRMCDLPLMGLTEGGAWWFTNLTVVDPYYILPLATCITMAVMLELGAESMKVAERTFVMKCIMRSMPLMMFIFMSNFPAVLAVHWLTNNVFALIQNQILMQPRVKQFLNMPEPVTKKASSQKNITNMSGEAVKQLKLYRSKRQLEDRKAVATMDFKTAGEGPIPKTYSYNPKEKKLS